VEIFLRDRPALPLYQSAKADAFGARLQGARTDYFDPRGTLYSSADWFVTE
jgi:hypothetical protein